MLVKSSIANLNTVKHGIKGGNSFDVLCNHTDFLSDCIPDCPSREGCAPPTAQAQGCTDTGGGGGEDTLSPNCNSRIVLCEP